MPLPTSWGETTITYNNAPTAGNLIASSGAVTQISWVEIDVSAYITQNGVVSLALLRLDNNVIDIDSRETANAPQLVIEAGPIAPPVADFSGEPQSGPAPTPSILPITRPVQTAICGSLATASLPPWKTRPILMYKQEHSPSF